MTLSLYSNLIESNEVPFRGVVSSHLVSALVAWSLRFSSSLAFYDENGPVTLLTAKNFKQLVLDSNEVWMVEFFAPFVIAQSVYA